MSDAAGTGAAGPDLEILRETESVSGVRTLVARDQHEGREYLLEEFGLDARAAKRISLELAREIESRAEELACVAHPALVKPLGVVNRLGVYYLLTPFYEGVTLDAYVSRGGPPDLERAVEWMITLAEVMAQYHGSGRLMRCLQAEHVVVADNGTVLVLDPGTMDALAPYRGLGRRRNSHVAPEILKGATWGEPADVFAAGALFYYVTTGRLPFDAASPELVTENVRAMQPREPHLRNPAMSTDLSRLILDMLEKREDRRIRSGADLLRRLLAVRSAGRLQSAEGERAATERRARAADRRDRILRVLRALAARRAWIGGGIAALLVLAYLLRPARVAPALAPDAPPQEVVSAYYKAIDELDMDLLEETIDPKAGKRISAWVTNLYVAEKVNLAMQLQRGPAQGESARPDLVRVENLAVERVSAGDDEVAFRATYVLAFPSESGPATEARVDYLRLAKVDGRWKIVSVSDSP